MKRVLVPTVAAAAAVLVLAVVNASAGHTKAQHHNPGHLNKGGTIRVVERATTDAVTNGSGDSAGNILTFANDVYDAADAHKVGSDQGYCVRTVVGAAWECNWTTFLPGGQITVEGPFSDTGDTVVAVTGGTGAYRNTRGSMQLIYHNPAGTEFDFVFNLVG
jgi:allene oxide cyclase